MKMTVLCAGLAAPHAGWVSIDELAQLMAATFDAPLLSAAALPDPLWRRAAGRPRPRFAPVETAGGDVLFVVARGPEDLALAGAIPDVRRKFSRVYAWVTDSYFHGGYVRETALYDAITVTAHEDTRFPQDRFGVRAHVMHQGIDALRWAPRQEHRREIDLVAFGRTPPSYHRAFQRRFHDMDSPLLYLHSPLGSLSGPTVHAERAMLFKLLHRTSVSLAFHLLVEPQNARPRSMMVTSRWLESLVSGCIVAGRRPVSRMADEMLDWPGCTLELPEDPEAAADAIETLHRNRDDLAAQRVLNVRNTLERHDWRLRMDRMCELFAWERPDRLREERVQVEELALSWQV